MAEPASWQLLEYLRTLVQGVTVANGYYTDLGTGLIILDDGDAPEDSSTPATIIDASVTSSVSGAAAHLNSTVDISLEFSVPLGTPGVVNPKLLVHRARNDLARALMVKPSTLPRFITSFETTGAVIGGFTDRDSGAAFVVAQVTARAGLTELKSPAPNP